MKHYLENLDSQMREGVRLGRSFEPPESWRRISRICFFGMGGSAVSGDLLRVLNLGKVSYHIFRSPQFPRWIGRETLTIFSSYSGNTSETLGAFHQALKSGVKILAVSSGGELEKITARRKIPFIKIPAGFPPRCAVGYLTFALVPLFHKMGWSRVPEKDIREAISAVRNVRRAKAKFLAGRMAGRFVHFYGASGFSEPVLARWRAQFAENAKTLTSSHLMPEMFHNEVQGWQYRGQRLEKRFALFLTSKEMSPQVERKMRRVQKMIRETGAGCVEIKARGRSLLARLFSVIALGDWTSYELARLNQVNPLDISKIENLKKIK